MPRKFKFTAFISYSHADIKTVAKLHRALEGYRLPKHLVGQKTSLGVIPKKMPPFFRDRDDLSAATNLTASVKKALRNSQFLIVICSPDGAKSRWVDKEIREFEKIHGRENILCFIVGDNTKTRGIKAIDCFPPRILEMKAKGDYEPIAADSRPEGDGKRLAKLKLIAGLLGIELDQLIQRDAQRRQQRQAAVMAFSLLGVVVLSVLLGFAIEARKEAEANRRIAEERQFQAENLVEFMLGDLRENLAPIGSLEMMDKIAVQALGYYASFDPNEMNAQALSQRSEVLLMLGNIASARGNMDQARSAFREAFLTTEELLERDPQNPERIFDHAQSVFYLGLADYQKGDFEQAEVHLRQYSEFAQELVALEPDNQDYVMEVGFAHSNLGSLYYNQGRFEEAEREFQDQLAVFQRLARETESTGEFGSDLAQSYAWLADAQLGLGKFQLALENRRQEREIYNNLLAKNPRDNLTRGSLVVNYHRLGLINAFLGQMDKAGEYFSAGKELGENLFAFDPENTETIANLSRLIIDFAELYTPGQTRLNKPEALKQALNLTEILMERDASQFDWRLLNYKSNLLQAEELIQKAEVENGLEIAKEIFGKLEDFWELEDRNYQILEQIGFAALVLANGYRLKGQEEEARRILQNFTQNAENLTQGMTIRAHDYLARAWSLLGEDEKARQKQDFLLELGYNTPAFASFLSKGARK